MGFPHFWLENFGRTGIAEVIGLDRFWSKVGAFLVRDSKHGGANSPFTLSVLNHGKVFNINIR